MKLASSRHSSSIETLNPICSNIHILPNQITPHSAATAQPQPLCMSWNSLVWLEDWLFLLNGWLRHWQPAGNGRKFCFSLDGNDLILPPRSNPIHCSSQRTVETPQQQPELLLKQAPLKKVCVFILKPRASGCFSALLDWFLLSQRPLLSIYKVAAFSKYSSVY